jgi:hypothetical protein
MIESPPVASPLGPVARGPLVVLALAEGYQISFYAWEDAFTHEGVSRLNQPILVLGPIDFLDQDRALFRMTVTEGVQTQTQYRVLCELVDGKWVVVERGVEELT